MRQFLKRLVQYFLWLLAKNLMLRFHPEIVVIAGVTGKTVIKNSLFEAFHDMQDIRANPKSYNTKFGLPLAILGLELDDLSLWQEWGKALARGILISFTAFRFPKKLILELGIERKGDMRYLLSLIHPKIAILSNIVSSYTLLPSDIEMLRDEMRFLIDKLPKDGLLVFNADDKHLMELRPASICPTIGYGKEKGSDYIISNEKETNGGREFSLKKPDGEILTLRVDRYGEIYIQALVIETILREYWEKHAQCRDA